MPADRPTRPTRMGETLDRVLAGLGSPPASSLRLLEGAWDDIVGPAAAVGVKFEPGLTQRLIAELVGPDSGDYDAGALPLLSHALATIWRHRSGNQLTVAGYPRLLEEQRNR